MALRARAAGEINPDAARRRAACDSTSPDERAAE